MLNSCLQLIILCYSTLWQVTFLWILVWFILRPCQHDDGYIDGRSQIKVHTDERTQVHSARSSLTVTHPRNRGRRCLTSVKMMHWASLGRHRMQIYVNYVKLCKQALMQKTVLEILLVIIRGQTIPIFIKHAVHISVQCSLLWKPQWIVHIVL